MSGLEGQSIWLVLVAPAAGIIGAILGVIGAGLVQSRLQKQRLQDAATQTGLARSHELYKLKLEMTLRAKIEAMEQLSQAGAEVYLIAWRLAVEHQGRPSGAEQARLQVAIDELDRAFGHALLYMPTGSGHYALSSIASVIAMDAKLAAEHNPDLSKKLYDSWASFVEDLKQSLPIDAVRPPSEEYRPDQQ